ncbi:MAG: glucokinase [Gemmatimonadales bacterium]|nr:glucokinase [Gemmatimonadales bacterium]
MRLIADIGGTNVRFAVMSPGGRPRYVTHFKCADYRSFPAAIDAYLAHLQLDPPPSGAAFAVAAPVLGDRVRFTNNTWAFSIDGVRRRYGFADLQVINDFSAIALAIPRLRASDRRKIGAGRAIKHAAIGVIGPGTGLGVSGLIWTGRHFVPLASEGGKVTLPPFDDFEAEILQRLRREFAHVSAERLLSGDGLALLYRAIGDVRGHTVRPLSAKTITTRARSGECATCRLTINAFCAMLGTIAADLALTLGALGGMYIAGGIVPKFGPLFVRSPFRKRFESKGRFSRYLAGIPTYLITHPNPGLEGLGYLIESRPDA